MLEITVPEAERRMEELLNRVERGETIAIIGDEGRRTLLTPATTDSPDDAENCDSSP